MTDEEKQVAELIRAAFRDVRLGDGIGLMQGKGLDDYADKKTVVKYRLQDEKDDWSKIPAEKLNDCHSSLSFFDAEGMRFRFARIPDCRVGGKVESGPIISPDGMQRLREITIHLVIRISAEGGPGVFVDVPRRVPARPNPFLEPLVGRPLERALAEYWTNAAD